MRAIRRSFSDLEITSARGAWISLLQKGLASCLGADSKTVNNWETGKSEPRLWFIPGILSFLGYDPRPVAMSFGERLRMARTARGLSIQALAGLLGADAATVWKCEKGRHRPIARLLRRLEETFGSLC
jgi:transcriptional regulator with XRE-family HTH domain